MDNDDDGRDDRQEEDGRVEQPPEDHAVAPVVEAAQPADPEVLDLGKLTFSECHHKWDRCNDFKFFSPKNLENTFDVFAQNSSRFFCKKIITLVYKKTPILFANNWQKSQKIVIIAST
jgi:hypothetical protein